MEDMSLAGSPFRQALAEGQYPLLPWLAVFVVGFVAGRWIASGRLRPIASLGSACTLSGAVGHFGSSGLAEAVPSSVLYRAFVLRLGWFPCSAVMVLLMMGAALLTVAFGLALERRWHLTESHALVATGRVSLTVFLLHIPLFREVSVWVGLRQSLSASADLAVVAIVLVAIVAAARWWQRVGFRFGAEWLLRRVAG